MSMARSRRRPVTLIDVLERSGVPHIVLDFAMSNGYRLPVADQSFDEQVASIRRRHPEMDHNDALTLLGCELNSDVADFFNLKFPIVGRNAA